MAVKYALPSFLVYPTDPYTYTVKYVYINIIYFTMCWRSLHPGASSSSPRSDAPAAVSSSMPTDRQTDRQTLFRSRDSLGLKFRSWCKFSCCKIIRYNYTSLRRASCVSSFPSKPAIIVGVFCCVPRDRRTVGWLLVILKL